MNKLHNLIPLVVIIASQGLVQSSDDPVKGFAIDVYKQIYKTEKGSFAVSPYSAQFITFITLLGSSGVTFHELSAALHMPNKQTATHTFAKSMLDRQSNDTLLVFADKLYVKQGYKIEQDFADIVHIFFDADIGSIDFTSSSAAQEINKWVEDNTKGKIKNLVSRDDFNNETRLALINTLLFNATWSQPFSERATMKKPFYVNHQTKKETDVMTQAGHFPYYESAELKAKFLELPFEGNATMTFVLPNDKTGLSSLEEKIEDVLAPQNYKTVQVNVEIPKFKIESTFKFEEILQKLGVKRAFTDLAEFDIVEGTPIKISTIKQKAFLELQEEGATAAAATIVNMVQVVAMVRNSFIADHPFLYYIQVNGEITFIGRYLSP